MTTTFNRATPSARIAVMPAGAAVAPWWHTGLVLAVLALGSFASFFENGFPNAYLPGLGLRMSGYVTVLLEEWLLFVLIWLWLRRVRLPAADIVGGSWPAVLPFGRDIGLAVGFSVLVVPLTSVLLHLVLGHAPASLVAMMPKTWPELAMWIALAASAGFCEEFAFRGYLMRQFTSWTGSAAFGIVLQGVAFGLAHGYYGYGMIVIMVHGALLGVLAWWRRSLRPGILAHGLQDTLGGAAAFLS